MYKLDAHRYINAGEQEFYRWGRKAQDKVRACMVPNKQGFYSIPADGGRYYTIGTSTGKFGEFAKWKDTFFSVNSAGYIWAKEGTPKAKVFVEMCQQLLDDMIAYGHEPEEEEEDED